jgi:hypothetical protein
MVAAYARVNVSKELAPLRDGHASLQDACRGALIQLAVHKGERFGHPGDASVLGSVRQKLPSVHPGDIFVSPLLRAGDWLCVHGLGLVRAIPLKQGEYKRLIRGVLVHRLCTYWVRGSPRGFPLIRGCRLEVY